MLALLEEELVSKRKWIAAEEFADIVAITESTPGPIAINNATYIGYKMAGFFGAVCASVAVCIPSVVIIVLISLVFDSFLKIKLIACAFQGIKVGVLYLIATAGLKMFKQLKKNAFSVTVFAVVLAAFVLASLIAGSFSAIACIVVCAFAGWLADRLTRTGKEAEK